jgi:hypothetical protein
MDEQHNNLMKYVLDEPEEAALELARLRESRTLGLVIAFLCGVLCALWFG